MGWVFQAFQDVVSVELAMPPSTGESPPDMKKPNRGFAFAHFASHAVRACLQHLMITTEDKKHYNGY